MNSILNRIIPICTTMLITLGVFYSCKQGKSAENKTKTDLLKYGVPYAIQPPADISISNIGQGTLTDVSIKNNTDYDVQVFMGNAQSSDIKQLKANKKSIFTSNPLFSKIIEEYEDGYLYEIMDDDGRKSYDFIIIKVVGSNEINFQCGTSKSFDEKAVKAMVKSIR